MQVISGGVPLDHERLRRFLLLFAAAVAVCALFYVFFRYLLWALLPVLSALWIASLCEPIVGYLRTTLGFRRSFSALLLTLTLLFLLGGLFSFLGAMLLDEVRTLPEKVPLLLGELSALSEDLGVRLARMERACPPWLQDLLRDRLAQLGGVSDLLLSSLSASLLSSLTALAAALPRCILTLATAALALYYSISDYPALRTAARQNLPPKLLRRCRILRGGFSRSLGHWIRAQSILLLVTFSELLLGFLLLRQEYALLLASLIALLDALPVFGTGTVLIPWALVLLLQGRAPKALTLAALYLCTLLVRNILEPRLLSSCAALPAIASLSAMYLGFCAFGVAGMIGFPFLLLLAAQLRQRDEKGRPPP